MDWLSADITVQNTMAAVRRSARRARYLREALRWHGRRFRRRRKGVLRSIVAPLRRNPADRGNRAA